MAKGFHLPISNEVFSKLHQAGIQIQTIQMDKWIFISPKGGYIPKKFYDDQFNHIPNHTPS
jgi:hypothetical protein